MMMMCYEFHLQKQVSKHPRVVGQTVEDALVYVCGLTSDVLFHSRGKQERDLPRSHSTGYIRNYWDRSPSLKCQQTTVERWTEGVDRGQDRNAFCYCSSKGQTLSNHRLLWPSHYGTVGRITGITSKCPHVPQHRAARFVGNICSNTKK